MSRKVGRWMGGERGGWVGRGVDGWGEGWMGRERGGWVGRWIYK